MNKQRVAVLFGGVSSEHEVSWKSAATILGGLDEEKYEIYPIGITRGGDWFYCPLPCDQIADGRWRQSPDKIPCTLSPSRADGVSNLAQAVRRGKKSLSSPPCTWRRLAYTAAR